MILSEDDAIECQSTRSGAVQGLKTGDREFLVRLGKLLEIADDEEQNKIRLAFPGEYYHALYKKISIQKTCFTCAYVNHPYKGQTCRECMRQLAMSSLKLKDNWKPQKESKEISKEAKKEIENIEKKLGCTVEVVQ